MLNEDQIKIFFRFVDIETVSYCAVYYWLCKEIENAEIDQIKSIECKLRRNSSLPAEKPRELRRSGANKSPKINFDFKQLIERRESHRHNQKTSSSQLSHTTSLN